MTSHQNTSDVLCCFSLSLLKAWNEILLGEPAIMKHRAVYQLGSSIIAIAFGFAVGIAECHGQKLTFSYL